MKYGIWLDEWFRNYIQPSSKIKTCERYSEIIEKHLKVKLGEYELDELTPLVLQRYVTELMQSGNIVTGKGLAANSVNGIITVIQNSLKLAYTLGELKEYTADKIKRPKTKEKEVSCFTLPEQKKIEQAVLTSKKPKLFGIVLCLYSGLRIGELLALEWSDIDFNKGTITVNKTCHDGRDENGKLCRITDSPKKFRYDKYDFAFDQMVDGVNVGAVTGGMRLKFLSVATDAIEKSEMRLMTESAGQIIAVLGDTPYYTSLEQAMKIRKYIKQRNVAQLPKSVQDIIRAQQDEATNYENEASEELRKAIETADFYVAGERLAIKSGDAKSRIEQALEYLVAHVYSELSLIEKNIESDAEIISIAQGLVPQIAGLVPNQNAAAKVEEYLELQKRRNLPTSMADIQSRYQAIPYGWREIDIASVVAILIHDQKVTLKYAGTTVQPDDRRLADMLRKRTEIGKVIISKREIVSSIKLKQAKEFLREYFDVMDIPDDEDGLVKFIKERFELQRNHYQELFNRYDSTHNYPDKQLVARSIDLMQEILSQTKDNIALIDKLCSKANDLLDNKDDMQNVESFFKNQVSSTD